MAKSHGCAKQADGRRKLMIVDACEDWAWLDPRWVLGTPEVFCQHCGRRIIFAPEFLSLPTCGCR